jgi:hypothetical protein
LRATAVGQWFSLAIGADIGGAHFTVSRAYIVEVLQGNIVLCHYKRDKVREKFRILSNEVLRDS